jgi:hypothetical protein
MKTDAKVKRRDFLRVLGAGAGAGAVATTTGLVIQEAAADSESNDEKRKPRYRANSPDVQAYYRVNRYPTK